ncbi:MAG: hypothetical protein CVV64_03115 [Candidatus Wallbacteria bacterium HGW-Wallbacteria-1]|jgi:hypothetical protein|uniref:Uncharacterized protein n=1 Tax=Candidatus Wallbacteria bacterium HGW-Wallbacteria-1 TaxID=2013854 RepID=A0A2N1PTN2_9BACT|nr:MAG: hypothetical protein CVV64_03115 [Candidatus Wallbacteria bacterium HGW-Wallbacteria-1]
MTTSYKPLFVEETFLVYLYGTKDEQDLYNSLISDTNSPGNLLSIKALTESLKSRHLTKMDWKCCDRCQNFQTCSLRFYRSAKGEKMVCCSNCKEFSSCLSDCRSLSRS